MPTVTRRHSLGLILLAVAAPAATAAPPPPTVEARVRGVNDLLSLAEYVGGLADQAEAGKQVAGLAKAFANPKTGLEGIDPARPFGFYAAITPDVQDSPAVLMIPVADEAAFLKLLTGRLNLKPKKGDGDVYEVRLPNLPLPVYFTFRDGYAFACLNNTAALADDARIAPKDFFPAAGGPSPVAAVTVHLDRIPESVRKPVLAQIELGVADEKRKERPGEKPVAKLAREWGSDQTLAAMLAVAAEGKTMTFTLDIAPKTDDITAVVTLVPRAGTPLAANIRGWATKKSVSLPPAASPVLAGRVNLGLPPEALKAWMPVADAALAEAVADAKENDKVGVQAIVDAFGPTVRAGVLDMALTADGKLGKSTLTQVLRVVEGEKIAETAEFLAPHLPKEVGTIKLGVEKKGGVAVHQATVPEAEKAFGTPGVWLGTAPDRFLFSVEPDGRRLKAATERKPEAGPVVAAELSIARLAAAGEKKVPAETLEQILDDVFGDAGPAGRDALTLTVTGGETATAKLTTKGLAFKFLFLVGKARDQE